MGCVQVSDSIALLTTAAEQLLPCALAPFVGNHRPTKARGPRTAFISLCGYPFDLMVHKLQTVLAKEPFYPTNRSCSSSNEHSNQ